jgi:excinuclease ABC subunit C
MGPSDTTSGTVEELRRQAAALPELPGVYLMRDETKVVIYVGKAKDLRARVRTYFNGGDGRYQIDYLLKRINTFETIVTQTESQAFLLERDLITKYKPRYNIKLKDDKSYLSVRIDERSEWPRLEMVRRIENDGASYFGPYAFSNELRNTMEVIKKVLPLRSCPDTVLYNRQRPCLEYQIGRCCAPCCLPVARDEYRELLKQAIGILEGRSSGTLKVLHDRMDCASEELRFEEAAAWRDRIETLTKFQAGHSLVTFRGENRDVFAVAREGISAAVCVLLVRGGRISETKTFTLFDVGVSNEEVLESVIQQFYESGREVPKEIILPCELMNASLLEGALTEKRGSKVEMVVPQRGSKSRLLSMAELNAQQALSNAHSLETEWDVVSETLAALVGIKNYPRRVECVDISNFQGIDTVGAIVVSIDGVAAKSHYRRYKLSQQGKPDDFASIYEVVSRRLTRGRTEDSLPDLLVIDGGPGQLAMALRARDELALEVPIISLAKMRTESAPFSQTVDRKPERLYIPGREDSVPLDEAAAVTRFLARIRDEVHRYVITFHRQLRSKRVFRSALDEVGGLGPEGRTRLLKAFGSIEAIRASDPERIASVGRMPLSLAKKIVAKLRKGLSDPA